MKYIDCMNCQFYEKKYTIYNSSSDNNCFCLDYFVIAIDEYCIYNENKKDLKIFIDSRNHQKYIIDCPIIQLIPESSIMLEKHKNRKKDENINSL